MKKKKNFPEKLWRNSKIHVIKFPEKFCFKIQNLSYYIFLRKICTVQWRDSELVSPQWAPCGVWIILSWRQLRCCRLKRNVYLSFPEFKLGTLSIIRVIIEISFNDLSIWWDKLLVSGHLVLCPVNFAPPLWSPWHLTSSLPQDARYTSF